MAVSIPALLGGVEHEPATTKSRRFSLQPEFLEYLLMTNALSAVN